MPLPSNKLLTIDEHRSLEISASEGSNNVDDSIFQSMDSDKHECDEAKSIEATTRSNRSPDNKGSIKQLLVERRMARLSLVSSSWSSFFVSVSSRLFSNDIEAIPRIDTEVSEGGFKLPLTLTYFDV